MVTVEQTLTEHPFFVGFSPEHSQLVGGCARYRYFKAGDYLCHEGDPADEFFLIREGKVALDMTAPGHAPIIIATVGPGEIVGASWVVPPYRWMFEARAVELTRAIGIDAACLRGKCDADHNFGYEMMKRFLPVVVKRLDATRLQLLDVYGKH